MSEETKDYFVDDGLELFDMDDVINIETRETGSPEDGKVEINEINLHEEDAPEKPKEEEPEVETSEEEEEEEEPKEPEVEEPEVEVSEEDEPEKSEEEQEQERLNHLIKLGYLYLPENYEFESFEKAVEDSDKFRTQDVANSLLAQVPEEGKNLLEYLINGGQDIREFREVKSEQENLKDYDLAKEEDQKAVLRILYKEKGFVDKKIDRLISRAEDSDELEEDSKDAYEELDKLFQKKENEMVEQAKVDKASKEEQAQEKYEILKDTLTEGTDFNGYEIKTDQDKRMALDALYNKVKLKDGREVSEFNHRLYNVVLSNPKLTLALSDILNKMVKDKKSGEYTFNFSTMTKNASNKAKSKLKDTLDYFSSKSTGPKNKDGALPRKKRKGDDFEWEWML